MMNSNSHDFTINCKKKEKDHLCCVKRRELNLNFDTVSFHLKDLYISFIFISYTCENKFY